MGLGKNIEGRHREVFLFFLERRRSIEISANVTEGKRGRGHQKRFDSINTAPVFLSLPLGSRFVPRGWGEGEREGKTTAPFALPIMATRQGKTPTFPIFF